VVDVLVILDGASEPLGAEPTSLELACTPALDALAVAGTLSRLRTVAPWLEAGSEAAIPALLGWIPHAPVDRGAVEAAAHGIEPAPGERAWRVDVSTAAGERADAVTTRCAAAELQAGAPRHRVRPLAGHRLLMTGPPPLPAAACRPRLAPWPEGAVPPRLLGRGTVVIGARGAAIGVARLMGAATIVPAGTTGQPGSDLAAKAAAGVTAIEGGAGRVVVHVGGPDEAAHACDRAAKIAAVEQADRDLIASLAAAVRAADGTLRVCPDHGCDPATGAHDAAPVPCLDWSGGDGPATGRRLTERAVAELPVVELAGILQAEAA
jgi:2,3-bisphosphoglycerate-independent phosphoglycerate mutase